jgi:threonine/homoserine/homoserine lactone efflux protein
MNATTGEHASQDGDSLALLAFLLEAVVISLSGVMAPGPITTVTIGKGNESPHAGAWVAIGHGIVEFPLMLFIFFGFGHLLRMPYAKAAISLLGGLFLVMMAVGMFRSVREIKASPSSYARSPTMAGILLSLGNAYFLIWWATVGATLISRSAQFGPAGFLSFALAHLSCDFLWDYFLSALSFKGGQFFGRRFQRAVFAMCGAFLLFYSAKSILDAVQSLLT